MMTEMKHTGDLLKMDLRRTFRTQPFYWLLLGVATLVMVVFRTAAREDNVTLMGLLGSYTAGEGFDPMASMMGISIIPLFSMIAFVLNVGGDFSTGFAKNIFTFHANKWEYVISKTALGAIISSLYILAYMIGFLVVGSVMGLPWGVASIGEMVLYVIQKMLLTIPLSSLVLFVMILLRNRGWGIVSAIAVSMGSVSMFVMMAASILTGITGIDFSWLSALTAWFISGCSSSLVLMASVPQSLKVLGVTAIWTLLWSVLTWNRLKKKDIL